MATTTDVKILTDVLLADIKGRAAASLSWRQARNTNLHIQTKPLAAGAKLLAYKQRIPVERDSVLVFADDAPQANWAHPCRYLLHDAGSGELYAEIAASFPPYMRTVPRSFRPFHEPVVVGGREIWWPILPQLRCPIRWSNQRYAVLFSGGSNNRHTNDLEFLYRTLRDIYGFAAANIFVLNYDGSIDYSGNPHPVVAWPGDASAYRMPVNGRGTKADLDATLDTIAGRIKANDLLLIHTNNHGGHNGSQSYLCTYSGPDYLASDFAAKLATMPQCRDLMVMMEQCHAGGFNAPILAQSTATHTSVSSACEELRQSIGGAHFDPFAHDWIAAMAGHTAAGGALASNPDSDGSGKVSAQEAHNYADAIHHPFDTPVFSASSAQARACFLGRRYSYLWPIYCRLLVDVLWPYYRRLPLPDYYEIVHERLVPELAAIEKQLAAVSTRQERDLAVALKEATDRVFG